MKSVVFSFLLFNFASSLAQDSLNHTIISQKYKGGSEAFIKDIASKIQYPQSAKEADYYAIAIVYLNINANGVLENVDVLNQLKYGISNDLKTIFLNNKTNWTSSESGYSLYLSVTYSLYDNYAKIINVEYPEIISENILTLAYETGEDSLIREKVDYRKLFQNQENDFNKYINKEYYKKAKTYLNRLLIMDPFYQDYYRSRLNIEGYTKLYDYACRDLNILRKLWNIRVKKIKVKCSE